MKRYYFFILALGVICLSAVALQFGTSKGPATDRKIVSDFQSIQYAIDEYASTNKRLPEKLTQLKLTEEVKRRAEGYGYRTKSNDTYELCATFKTDASTKNVYASHLSSSQSVGYHKKGYQCFEEKTYSVPNTRIPASRLID